MNTTYTIDEITNFLREELSDAKRDMVTARTGNNKINRIATESKYNLIFMICNDLGITE